MDFYAIVDELAKKKKWSMEDLSKKLGKTEGYMRSKIHAKGTPKIDTAAMIVDKCGYTLCVVPKKNVPEDAIKIDF